MEAPGESTEEAKIPPTSTLLPFSEGPRIVRALVPFVEAGMVDVGGLAAEIAAVEPLVRRSPELERLLLEAGERITRINEQTRRVVSEQLREAAARGYNTFQVANGVPDDGFRGVRATVRMTYRNRHLAIARTEMAFAAQRAAHDRYRAASIMEVEIADGDGCGWRFHDDDDVADGTIRTLEAAEEFPIAHPNCVRVSIPVLPRLP
jgi:hypothetical protein